MQPRIRMTELTVIRILKITKTLPQHPYGWPKKGFPGPQGPYYCGVGANKVCLQFLQNNLWIFLIDFKLCLYFRCMAERWWRPTTAPASLPGSTSLGQTQRSQDDDSEVIATLTEEKNILRNWWHFVYWRRSCLAQSWHWFSFRWCLPNGSSRLVLKTFVKLD